ncbi:MAG TPA: hypothetical protein VFG80_08605, partial [Myxococcota bacterium]|nr:hypothetical protein [Myxococcota bacterium]
MVDFQPKAVIDELLSGAPAGVDKLATGDVAPWQALLEHLLKTRRSTGSTPRTWSPSSMRPFCSPG